MRALRYCALAALVSVLAGCVTPDGGSTSQQQSLVIEGAEDIPDIPGFSLDDLLGDVPEGTKVRVRVRRLDEEEKQAQDDPPPSGDSTTLAPDLADADDDDLMRALEQTLRNANAKLGTDFEMTGDVSSLEAVPTPEVSQEALDPPSQPTSSPSPEPRPTREGSQKRSEPAPDKEEPVATRRARPSTQSDEDLVFGRSSALSR